MGITGEQKAQLRGDASVRKQAEKDEENEKDKPKAKVEKQEVLKKSVAPVQKKIITSNEKPVQYSEVSKPKTYWLFDYFYFISFLSNLLYKLDLNGSDLTLSLESIQRCFIYSLVV